MTKIGNTDSWVLTCLHQYVTFIAWGGEVKMSAPHPDIRKAEHAHASTFSVVSEHGDIKPCPDAVEALNLMARLSSTVGDGRHVSVEKVPAPVDEETYIVRIKKR